MPKSGFNPKRPRSDYRGMSRVLVALFVVTCVVLAVFFIKPAVPNSIRMLTGPKDSTFYTDGLRYKGLLEKMGITVLVEETAGSLENIEKLLQADGPTVAFGNAILAKDGRGSDDMDEIESLGTLYLQPLWVFSKRGAEIDSLMDLRGTKIASGRSGSGSRAIALFLLESTGAEDDVHITQSGGTTFDDVVAALQSEKIGAVVAAGQPGGELIDRLLRAPAIEVLSIQRAEAIAARYPFLTRVRFPEGVHDLKANIPDKDLVQLASGTELLVSAPFPAALSDALLETAGVIHGPATLFSSPGQFPNPDMASVPLNTAAAHYYAEGPSKLRKFLPFRLATLVDRFLWLMVGGATAAIAIFSVLPRFLILPFNIAINRVYRRLEAVEKASAKGGDRDALCAELDRLEDLTASMRVPIRTAAPAWFEMRQNLHDVYDRVKAQSAS